MPRQSARRWPRRVRKFDLQAESLHETEIVRHAALERSVVHDRQLMHMHVVGRGSAVSSEVLAGAVWGLAVWLCEHGASRFGVCADERCGNVYLDTSSNCCRRFCSERCATRSHVAAHRARKRALTPV